MKPFFGIVLRAYNKERYISKAIESVIAQTCQDWILYIVDDGSEDGTADICDRFSKQDERIHVIHQANMGCVLATQNTVKAMDCAYVALLDADDWYDPKYLESAKEMISMGGVEIIVNGLTVFDENQRFLHENRLSEYDMLVNGHDAIRHMFKTSVFGIVVRVFKRSLFKYHTEIENFFESKGKNLNNNEDIYQVLPLLLNAGKVGIKSTCLYNYRVDRAGISGNTEQMEKIYTSFLTMEYCRRVFMLYGIKSIEFDLLCFGECQRQLHKNLTTNILNALTNAKLLRKIRLMPSYNDFKNSIRYGIVVRDYGIVYAAILKLFLR